MVYSNLLRISGKALLRNRLRAILTALGIIIGVASVIAMLSLGEGSKRSILSEMSDMGTNMVMIMPSAQSRGGVAMGGSANTLKMSDVETLRAEAGLLADISPQVQTSKQVIYGNENYQTSVYGVSEEYMDIRKLNVSDGRMFTGSEVRGMAKVCILGQTVVDELFGENVNPVDMSIRIGNIPFQVIGVLEDKGESGMGQDQDDMIIAPYTTVQRRLANIDYLNGIICFSSQRR
jgi:putative ABC transport system permease protein